MFAIEIQVRLVDDTTGETALSQHGGNPVVRRTRFFPLFEKSEDGEAPAHTLYEAVSKVMHLGSDFYRVGGIQKDL